MSEMSVWLDVVRNEFRKLRCFQNGSWEIETQVIPIHMDKFHDFAIVVYPTKTREICSGLLRKIMKTADYTVRFWFRRATSR